MPVNRWSAFSGTLARGCVVPTSAKTTNSVRPCMRVTCFGNNLTDGYFLAMMFDGMRIAVRQLIWSVSTTSYHQLDSELVSGTFHARAFPSTVTVHEPHAPCDGDWLPQVVITGGLRVPHLLLPTASLMMSVRLNRRLQGKDRVVIIARVSGSRVYRCECPH